MDKLVAINASSLYQHYSNEEWIPTGRKKRISLDLLNSSLTLEYSEFSSKIFSNSDLFSHIVKRVKTFYFGNSTLTSKQIDKYRYITNSDDRTNQIKYKVEAIFCSKLVEYSQLNKGRTTNLFQSRTNPEGKTIWFLKFSDRDSAAPGTPAEYIGIISLSYEFDFKDMSCLFTAFFHNDVSQ
jgi:hypothetical protein